MNATRRAAGAAVALAVSCLAVTSVSAQSLGTFRWQQFPYCNVITVNITQNGTVYQLDGHDDQCGAATKAAVVGMAYLNPNGTLGLGLTEVTSPAGVPLHLDASLSLASGSGPWHDSAGNTGTFVLTGATTGVGTARPAPSAAFPGGLSAGGAAVTNVAAPVVATDAANKAYVDGVTTAVRAALIGEKVWKGIATSTGTKGTTGPYTVTKLATGVYSMSFVVAGLGLPVDYGVFVATPNFCPGGSVGFGSFSRTSDAAGLVTFGATAFTVNAAGAAVDCDFTVWATMPDANVGSPIPPLVPGSRGAGACTTEGDLTTCTIGSSR